MSVRRKSFCMNRSSELPDFRATETRRNLELIYNLSALEIYSVWYVMKTNTSHGCYFMTDDYIKGGKTMAKGVGLSEEQFAELAGRIENMVRSGKDIPEDKVITEYRQFITETGIWDLT